MFQKYYKREAISKIEKLAKYDNKTLVKAAAIGILGKLVDPIYKSLFEKGMNSESYAVIGSSLISLYQIDKGAAVKKINTLNEEIQDLQADAITNIFISEQDKTKLPFIAKHVLKGMFLSSNKNTQQLYAPAFKWISESDNKEAIENMTNDFVKLGLQYKKYNFDKMAVNMLNQMVQTQKQSANANKEELTLILKTGMSKLIE